MNLRRIELLTELHSMLTNPNIKTEGAINITFVTLTEKLPDFDGRTAVKVTDETKSLVKEVANKALAEKIKSIDLNKESIKMVKIMIKSELTKEQDILTKARKLLRLKKIK